MTRRNLLWALPFSAASTRANSAVTVGLIGCGGRGSYDAGIVARDDRARLTALCDIFEERIARARTATGAADARAFRDYRDLLASKVDAVVIATPVYLHPEHLEAAIAAGKHVYIEKPAGVDVDGCRRVIRAGEQAGSRLNISFGFQQRYGPDYLAAKALLDSGRFGRIRDVHAQFIKGAITGREPIPPAPKTEADRVRQWTIWRALHGDIVVETHCHNIDVLNWFLGARPESAIGSAGRSIERRGDISDHVNVTFAYPGGVHAAFTGSQVAPQYYRTNNERFFCDGGVIETAREYWARYTAKKPVVEQAPRDITVDALAEFLRRVAQGKPENTAARSAESTMTAVLARMACDAGRRVTWDEMQRA